MTTPHDPLLTTKDLCKIFDVETMTVYNWRRRRSKTLTPIPFYSEERGSRAAIWFRWSEVKAWAELNKIRAVNSLESVVPEDILKDVMEDPHVTHSLTRGV